MFIFVSLLGFTYYTLKLIHCIFNIYLFQYFPFHCEVSLNMCRQLN